MTIECCRERKGWVVCRLQNVAAADALRSLYEVLLSYGPCRKVANSILTTCHTPPPAGHLITLNIKHMPGNRTLGNGRWGGCSDHLLRHAVIVKFND